MRHAIAGNRLGRNSSWRKATIRDIAKATLIRQRICTTKAKAKEACKLVDKLITLGKKGALSHHRDAFAILCDHKLVSKLFKKIAPRFKNRNGGYTRIIPLAMRRGDNAQLVYLELTEKEEVVISKPKSTAAAKTKEVKDSLDSATTAETKDKVESVTGKAPVMPKGKGKGAGHKQTPAQEKGKPGKNIVGGIKKMFRRKTAE
ncbi:MAG: 50S ribosomal protein L17 [Candidatus Omnitrophica bacterium]|nr:50S ribosomal protein L17 [Candidatus Omnitrophota bacterium]